MLTVKVQRTTAMLDIGQAEDSFKLHLQPITARGRMDLVDACTQGFGATQRAIEKLVIGWSDIVDENGRPVGYSAASDEDEGPSRFDRVIGSMPLSKQVELVAAVLTYAGLRREAENFKRLLGRQDAERLELDPTRKPAEPTPATTSSGSSSCETSPNG